MSNGRTWFISLDTSHAPGGSIELGQIITDPRDAQSRIDRPHLPPAAEDTLQCCNQTIRLNTSLNFTGRVFIHFLNAITLGLYAAFQGRRHHQMTIPNYTIHTFEPTPQYVAEAMNNAGFDSAIRKGNAYMIVGLQVADSAIVYHLHQNTQGGGATGGAPIGATGAEVGGQVDINMGSQMSQKFQINSKFIFAYRIKRFVSDRDGCGLASGFTVPPRGFGLYDTNNQTSTASTAVADFPPFILSPTDANEDMIEGKYEVIEPKDGDKSTERMVMLEESHPWWLYYTSAVAILVYAWLAYYLVGKFT